MKAFRANFVLINHGILWSPDASQAAPRMLHDLYLPTERRFDPLHETTLLVSTIGPDQLQPRKAVFEQREQKFPAIIILDIGFMHQHLHDQAIGIDEQMPLAAFDFFAAIVAAKPPFWLVFTD